MVKSSLLVQLAFAALALLLTGGFIAALRATARRNPTTAPAAKASGVIALLWISAAGLAAIRGVLSFQSTPPTMFLVIGGTFLLAIAFARSRVAFALAQTVPLWLLVGWQAFRFPLELLLHRAYREWALPVEMSFSGRNFDIVTGATALVVAALVARGVAGKRVVMAWNVLGVLLLVNVLSIALRLRPAWVTQFPFVWLPAVMVATAVVGHVLILRRLLAQPSESRASAQPAAQS